MNNTLLVSIVIANFNGQRYLENCLDSILASTYQEYEIIIVDDGSTDESKQIISSFKNKDQRIILIENEKNLGASASRNRAIKQAQGEILVFLDNDTQVEKGWLNELLQAFKIDSSIGAVQAILMDYEKRDLVQNAGVRLWAQTGWGLPEGQWNTIDKNCEHKEIIAISACLAVKKVVLIVTSGFDEEESVVTEDLDLSWRIWIAGYKIVLAPKSIVYHWTKSVDMRSNMHHNYEKIYFHLTKNSLTSILKNYQFFNAIYFFFYSLFISGGRAILVYLRRHDTSALIGTTRAIIWVIMHVPYILKARNQVQRSRKVIDNILFNNVILKGSPKFIYKKYFSQTELI